MNHQPADERLGEAAYWEQRYQTGNQPWNLGEPAPPFVYLLQEPDAPEPGSMIVLGAGRGYDAVLFAQHGFDVTAVDFAETAVRSTQEEAQRAGVSLEAAQSDIFALPTRYDHLYSYALEHTCFCAIDPSRREDYVKTVRRLLKPGGLFIALFFTHGKPSGPPFTTSEEEIRILFSPYFSIGRIETPAHSVPARRGLETLALMRPLAGGE